MSLASDAEPWRVLHGFVSETERELALQLARSPSWQSGRQGTGYDKLPLDPTALPEALQSLWHRTLHALGDPPAAVRDLFLLRYEVGAHLPPHVDPPLLDGALHRRLNALMVVPERGGILALDGEDLALELGDAVCFRPDRHRHQLSRIEVGRRLVWSSGCNLPR